ncbi:hypothetical protein NBM05_09250 [Rothia sp. AR01]|uniref:Uncharacterized protein n=1 Tax=Rothia santali TaxID=2949643 RepID=A0A9X2KHT5_9MICC|nr:hypothetical protein [Rothia santali]MCP3426187.1 hypothetical protein [Rothia santali]
MTSDSRSRQKHRLRWSLLIIVATALCLSVVLVLAWLRPWANDTEAPPESEGDASIEASDSGSFVIPDSFVSEPFEETFKSGERRWLDLTLDTYLEPGSAAAAYLAVYLGCKDSTGARALGMTGTQNIRQDEPTTIKMTGLVEATHAGEASCRVRVSAPNGEAVAAGMTVDIDTSFTLGARPVQGEEAKPRTSLPAVIDPGKKVVLFDDTLSAAEGERRFRSSASMHLTTCTIQNGSKDSQGGDFLCDESTLDRQGSQVSAVLSQEVEASDGNECGNPREQQVDHLIDHDQHHYIFTIGGEYEEPEGCRGTPKFTLTLENDGPAPVVVHSDSTRAYAGVDE